MSRIPSDVDNTIWQIAERGDHQAAQDFNEKFPALAQAMNDRMRMVSGMKDMRSAVAPTFVPPFKPRYLGKPKPKWRKLMPAGVGIAALAAASYYVAQNMTTPLPELKPDAAPAVQDSKGPRPDPFLLPPAEVRDDSDGDTPRVTLAPSFKGPSNGSNLQEITMDQVPFQKAMRDIAAHWHLTLQIPPKTPDPVLKRVDMFGKNGMDFLTQLAHQQGYTVFDEGHGKVLLIPEGQSPPDSN